MNKVAFHTLGCKLNFSETSTIARQFKDAGWQKVNFPDVADVYVINTCSVTENADKECKSIVNRAMSSNPDGKVIIIGCYAQLKPQEIAEINGVDLVLGAQEKFNVLEYIDAIDKNNKGAYVSCEIDDVGSFISAHSSDDRTRVFLKVQDGCDYSCTFCTIPLARGKSRSDTVENVVAQAKKIVESGAKEIVLTGINLGDFGIDAKGNRVERFVDLVKALDQLEGDLRIRISSIEPNLLTDEIIEVISKSNKFVPHFHIPLQSGSDTMLKLMRRRYLSGLYIEKVQKIKSLIPDCSIGVDVIVGFPGETDDSFNETVEFIKDLDVTYLHVFTYSERENTPAKDYEGKVSMSVRKQRNKILRSVSLKKQRAFYESCIGANRPVLFEAEIQNDFIYGYSDNYIRVKTKYDQRLVNKIVDCEILSITPECIGEVELLNHS
ncbi:MAG: tRNA (N(6)-L-threonylcarbamoyladenosine(37)-C(2))-methylthiotransferase MtaB [Bacteroidota bacterium]